LLPLLVVRVILENVILQFADLLLQSIYFALQRVYAVLMDIFFKVLFNHPSITKYGSTSADVSAVTHHGMKLTTRIFFNAGVLKYDAHDPELVLRMSTRT
jgi:hypothetical protein